MPTENGHQTLKTTLFAVILAVLAGSSTPWWWPEIKELILTSVESNSVQDVSGIDSKKTNENKKKNVAFVSDAKSSNVLSCSDIDGGFSPSKVKVGKHLKIGPDFLLKIVPTVITATNSVFELKDVTTEDVKGSYNLVPGKSVIYKTGHKQLTMKLVALEKSGGFFGADLAYFSVSRQSCT